MLARCLVLLIVATLVCCPTEYGTGFVEEVHAIPDDEIKFEACEEIVCDPLRVSRYTNVIKDIQNYYRKWNRPGMPMSMEAKMSVISNIIRNVFKEYDFIGFYYLNTERSTTELEIAPYSTIIKTPMPLFKKGEGIVGKAWEQEDAIVVRNIEKEKDYTTYDGRARSEVAVPIFDLKGKMFAVLKAYSELPKVFEQTDIICMEEVVNYLDY